MGYILNGIYHKTTQVPVDKLVANQQTMYKQGDHARQRFDHAAEIIQPYGPDGRPNPAMIEAFPDDAAQYGFIPKAGDIL